MLLNLHKQSWTTGLTLPSIDVHSKENERQVEELKRLAQAYTKRVNEESELSKEDLNKRHVGKMDPKATLDGGCGGYHE